MFLCSSNCESSLVASSGHRNLLSRMVAGSPGGLQTLEQLPLMMGRVGSYYLFQVEKGGQCQWTSMSATSPVGCTIWKCAPHSSSGVLGRRQILPAHSSNLLSDALYLAPFSFLGERGVPPFFSVSLLESSPHALFLNSGWEKMAWTDWRV